jgi:small subunit ribosomal protein S2
MAVQVDIKALLEAGVHFGHKTSRWHPKMAPYIHSKRQDSHIIDLTKTVEALETALPVITQSIASGKQVLLVGTKRQAKDLVRAAADKTGQPFVTERWMGGMLTNTETMVGRIKHLKTLEKKMDSGELANRYNKLEVQRFQEEIDDLNQKYGGIKDLNGNPGVVFVTDILEDVNAVREAKKLGVPVIAITDTNTNPTTVDYPIPANDDAIKGIALIIDYVVAAIEEGKATADKKEGK